MQKIKIVLWGTGKYGDIGYRSLEKSKCELVGVIDSSKEKIGTIWNGKKVESPNYLQHLQFDWLLIAVKESSAIMDMNIINTIKDKVIQMSEEDFSKYEWINGYYLKEVLQEKAEEIKRTRIVNAEFENKTSGLLIKDSISCLEEIRREKKSMVRFGDGEFEMMNNQARPWFQQPNPNLAKRLKEIITTDAKNLIIAIPDQFDSLDKYTEDAADEIRCYMAKSREFIMQVLSKDNIYYDAYVSRPYILCRDKEKSATIFRGWKKIWKDKKIAIVEGANTRNGVENDLFSGAGNITRIICPIKNAFDKYNEILDAVCQNVQKDTLVLISLGPTATVLAYDLYKKGYQAIDIGQIDNEYEWFLAKAEKRIHIKGKAVPEIGERNVLESATSEQYEKEILIDLS